MLHALTFSYIGERKRAIAEVERVLTDCRRVYGDESKLTQMVKDLLAKNST